MTPSQDLVELAERLADASGAVIRRYFRKGIEADDKADASPVTIADREAEAAIRELLAAHAPGHGIVGEEFGRQNEGAELVWVLDPIDGTKAFITGKPLFGTLIALLHRGRPVLGVINQPVLGDRWLGVLGRADALERRAGARPRVRGAFARAPLHHGPAVLPAGEDPRLRVRSRPGPSS